MARPGTRWPAPAVSRAGPQPGSVRGPARDTAGAGHLVPGRAMGSRRPSPRDHAGALAARRSLAVSRMTPPPPSPRSVTLADRAGPSFHAHAHAQGYARWRRGLVVIDEESPTAVTATVRGPRPRHIRLEAEGSRLLVHCTCPARTLERPGCKHVWAALLEVDRRGALRCLRSTAGPLRVGFLATNAASAGARTEPASARKPRKPSARKQPARAARRRSA